MRSKRHYAVIFLLVALALTVVTKQASGAPILWSPASGGNDHYYERVHSPNILWVNARDGAELRTYGGMTGYLATITSSGENAFIRNNFDATSIYGHWIGASDAASEGAWKWVTGPEAGTQFWSGDSTGSAMAYANWNLNDGEPNGGTEGYEDYAYIHLKSADPERGLWWDALIDGESRVSGYIVEYGGPATLGPPPVVENGGFDDDTIGDPPTKWNVFPGVTVVDCSPPAGNKCVSMIVASEPFISQDIEVPSQPFFLDFDYELLGGTLDVTLGSALLAQLTTPTSSFEHFNGLFDPLALGLTGGSTETLAFTLSGTEGDELSLDNIEVTPTPEPATLLLLGTGLAGLGLIRRRGGPS